jgi:hypothetical protein
VLDQRIAEFVADRGRAIAGYILHDFLIQNVILVNLALPG